MSCPRCTGPSRDGLCTECELEELTDSYATRADEMTDADRAGGESGGD